MLTETMRELIREFIKLHIAMRPGDQEAPNLYFRAKVGKNVSKSQGTYAGVYTKHFEPGDLTALHKALVDHVSKTWVANDEPAKVFLVVHPVGDNNPLDGIVLEFEGGTPFGDGAEEILTRGNRAGNSPMEIASASALLSTNHLLKDLFLANANQNRELIDHVIEAKVSERVMSMQLEVAQAGQAEARMERMFDRLDPHLEKWAPALILGLGTAAAAYGAKGSGAAAAVPPTDAEQAADWYIQRFGNAMFEMGTFFAAQPHLLNKEREAKVGNLIARMLQAAEQMKA